jgi:predicted dehydrogenase
VVTDIAEILEDESIAMINCAAVPNRRAEIAVAAMRHGKDVLVDKLGVTTFEQLDVLRRTQAETG